MQGYCGIVLLKSLVHLCSVALRFQVMDVINEEEKQFLKTLSRGKRLFERTVAKLEGTTIPGEGNSHDACNARRVREMCGGRLWQQGCRGSRLPERGYLRISHL